VRAAVFGLLHAGRVQAPALLAHELSLLTEFVAVGEVTLTGDALIFRLWTLRHGPTSPIRNSGTKIVALSSFG
jgi:hypothetical protein